MRLFVAVDIIEEVAREIGRIQMEIPEGTGIFSLTDPVQCHITLTFLGDVDDEKVDDVKEKLSEVEFEKFTLKTGELGFFPTEDYIRVFWLGTEDNEKLDKLAEDVRNSLPSFEDDHDFHSHITLARVKSLPAKAVFKKAVKDMEVKDIEWEVDSFKLMKSELTSEGPEYSVVEEYDSSS